MEIKMQILTEKYSQTDLAEMINIWNEVVREGKAFPQEDELDMKSGVAFFAAQSYCGVARVAESGKVCGMYILHPNNVGRCGHICNASYAVSPDFRGGGVGKKLVEDSLATAKSLGFSIIQFNAVVAHNHVAIKLYENLGFVPLGTVPGGFHNKTGEYDDIRLFYRIL